MAGIGLRAEISLLIEDAFSELQFIYLITYDYTCCEMILMWLLCFRVNLINNCNPLPLENSWGSMTIYYLHLE